MYSIEVVKQRFSGCLISGQMRWRLIILAALSTELLGLWWEDVDLNAGTCRCAGSSPKGVRASQDALGSPHGGLVKEPWLEASLPEG